MTAGIVDFAVGAGAIAAAFVAIAAMVEKVFSPLGKLLGKWITDPVVKELVDLQEYVRYHLGPNGTTTPIHRRLERLEAAHNIEDIEESP